ncbi:MAG: Hsp70 family protein [Minicystis sp.]
MFFDRSVGIDLGTTNSEIAMLDPSEQRLLIYADRFGRRTVPSAVAWDPKAGAALVGHAARARRGKVPPPIESIKRRMGQDTRVALGPDQLLPEEVSARILGELRARMLEYIGGEVAAGVEARVLRAVITVPAYFDAPQVEATRKAGELAGLTVIGILQEPTAAAIYHTWKSRLGDGNFLVYDLGGGTFDVSILRCVGGEYQVLAIDGDNYLGGDDLDRMFAERLRADLAKRGYALDLDVRGDDEDRRRFGRLVHLAQEIKEALSTSEVVPVSKQDFLQDKAGEPVSFEGDVGRAEYEEIVAPLVERTLACCERALSQSRERAAVGIAEIDHVVLVGGSTRVPLVMRRVTEALAAKSKSPKPLQDEVDTCVALGAAIHAAQLGGLRVGDAEKKTSVLFTTPLVTRSARLRLGLRVEEAPEGAAEVAIKKGAEELGAAPLSAPEASVPLAPADPQAAPNPGAPWAPVRLDVALGEEPETAVALVLRDRGGRALAELPLALYRGDVRPRASALSRPSVVAKDIALEVVRAGRRDRRVLIARGAGLPVENAHKLYTADQSGAVVLRLLQNRLPIKTLVLEVPKDLPVGTEVELTLKCDEAMRIEARAEVAGRKLWAQIERPEAPRLDPSGALEALLDEADSLGRSLWGTLGHAYRREADVLVTGIREVITTDPDKLQALSGQLHQLVAEFRADQTTGLKPPWHRFEAELDGLRRVVYRTPGILAGMDRDTWDARLADIESRSRTAFETSDAAGWRRAYNEVQALYETAIQEEFASTRLDDPAYLSRLVNGEVARANRVEQLLADFIPAAEGEVRDLQLAERDRLVTAFQAAVAPLAAIQRGEVSDAAELRRRLDGIGSELERIKGALERVPALGLVTERGA